MSGETVWQGLAAILPIFHWTVLGLKGNPGSTFYIHLIHGEGLRGWFASQPWRPEWGNRRVVEKSACSKARCDRDEPGKPTMEVAVILWIIELATHLRPG